MRKILISLLIVLFLAGSCFAETDQIKDIFNSVVKVQDGQTFGSGNCINQDDKFIYLITNHHVAGDVGNKVNAYFYRDGHQSSAIGGEVIWTAYLKNEPVDISVFKIPKASLGGWMPTIVNFEYNDTPLKEGDACLTIGCPSAKWPEAQRGHITKSSNGVYYITPNVIGGQSGSVLFNKDGSKAIGLIAWSSEGFGKAMNAQTLQNAAFGKKTNYYYNQPYDLKDQKQVKFTYAEPMFGRGRFNQPNDDCPDGNCPNKPITPKQPVVGGGNKIFPTSPEQVNPDAAPEAPKDPPKPSELELYKTENTGRFASLDERLNKIESNLDSSEQSRQNLLLSISKLETELKNLDAKVAGVPSKGDTVTPGKLEETVKDFNKVLEEHSAKIGESINALELQADETPDKLKELIAPIKEELSKKLISVDDAQNKIATLTKSYDELKIGISKNMSDIQKQTTEKISETNNTLIKEVMSGQNTDKYISIGGYSIPWIVVLILGWLYRRHFGGAAQPPFPTIIQTAKKMKI